MQKFLDLHQNDISGTLSCFDRIIITSMLPDIGYAKAITNFFYANNMMLKEFKNWVMAMNNQIKNNAETIAARDGLEIEFIRKTQSFRKEERIKDIIAQRGDHPGLVHIFSAMESCPAYRPWHDKNTHKNFFRNADGKCLHYYFYFIDKTFGLCYLRVPTWAPFRLQFYCNGHNYVARQLKKKAIPYKMQDNAFLQIDDFDKAQEIADNLPVKKMHETLDAYARKFCPPIKKFPAGLHWSIAQAEYATDIIFKDHSALAPLYEEMTRTLIHAVKPETVSMFLGKRLDPRFEGELNGKFSTRIEGQSIRHYMDQNGIKMYDKFGLVLRVETFSSKVSFFKHHRRVEHRDGSYSYKNANLRKTIYSLDALADIMFSCNCRYLDFLCAVEDPRNGQSKVKKLSERQRENGRSVRGFNVFDAGDERLFQILSRGELQAFGITNKRVRQLLEKSSSQVSYLFKRLRVHGIIKKVSRMRKYYLTSFGRQVVSSSLKLKEMVLVPLLRGKLLSS